MSNRDHNTNKTAQRVIDLANALGEVAIVRDRTEAARVAATALFRRTVQRTNAVQHEDGYWYLFDSRTDSA